MSWRSPQNGEKKIIQTQYKSFGESHAPTSKQAGGGMEGPLCFNPFVETLLADSCGLFKNEGGCPDGIPGSRPVTIILLLVSVKNEICKFHLWRTPVSRPNPWNSTHIKYLWIPAQSFVIYPAQTNRYIDQIYSAHNHNRQRLVEKQFKERYLPHSFHPHPFLFVNLSLSWTMTDKQLESCFKRYLFARKYLSSLYKNYILLIKVGRKRGRFLT
jgi:hypothetical protein